MRRIILFCTLSLLFLPVTGFSEEMSERDLKKAVRRADKAVGEGALESSRDLFRQILDATSPGDERRAMALYGTVMLKMASAGNGKKDDLVRSLLSEATDHFPAHPRRVELEAARRWLVEIDLVSADLADKNRELAEAAQGFEEDRKELEGVAGDQREDLESKIRRLRNQLASARSELEKKQAELDKKEEALQKLKDSILDNQG